MQIHEVLQFPSTNKMRKQKGTKKKKDENWEFRDKSNKVRESMKWWLKKWRERERERERER